jgi:hypothetical protein
MRAILGIVAALSIAGAANAALVNADNEFQPGTKFATAEAWRVTGGGWADHAGFAAANNETLGELFIFYSAGTTEIMGQISSLTFEAGNPYKFTSWAATGGDGLGAIPYQIGYMGPPQGDLPDISTDFVELATNVVNIDGQDGWALQEGVTYTPTAGGPEIGENIVVRFGNGDDGGATDIWIDNQMLFIVPEPASLGLLGLGGLLLRRR